MRFVTFFLILATFATMGKSQLINYGNLTRVQGGYRPKNGELTKYVASVLINDKGDFCGGTIIGNRAILTAAHCVVIKTRGGTRVARASLTFVGTGTDLMVASGTNGKQYKVKKIIKHRDYAILKAGAIMHDIAILILTEDIIFNKDTQKVALADSSPVTGKKCTVVGWGRLFYDGPIPVYVNYGDLIVVDDEDCQRDARNRNLQLHKASSICALREGEEEVNACHGDSGGPLFCDGKLAGVVSFTIGYCAIPKVPTVYADVNYYRDWIARNGSSFLRSGSYFERFLLVLLIFLVLTL